MVFTVETLAGVHMNRRPSSSAYQNLLSIISNIKSGTLKASAENVTFRDRDFLVANEIHHHYQLKKIRQIFHKRDEVCTYISQGVSVYGFVKHFKSQFEGKYNSLFSS